MGILRRGPKIGSQTSARYRYHIDRAVEVARYAREDRQARKLLAVLIRDIQLFGHPAEWDDVELDDLGEGEEEREKLIVNRYVGGYEQHD